MDAGRFFSQSYAEARAGFLAAAEPAGLDVRSRVHPMLGRDGEPLALDVVRDGPADAQGLLILSSACHGVEGFCGSGVQTALLHDSPWRERARAAGVAVLYLHALNPYGFSWWRRTTHENVDLNRNFHDFSRPLPRNAAYDEIAALLVPAIWPPSPEVKAALRRLLVERGLPALQAAVSGGQYDHAEGLYFGGRSPTWSQVALRQVLRDEGSRAARIGWIDVHTGLGPNGAGERIFACRDDAATLARARAWWGEHITSTHDGSSSSAPLSGEMFTAIYDECPQAEYTGIALEFGTEPLLAVFEALRAEQWLENHPETGDILRNRIKRHLRDAFYTDTEEWKQRVLRQAFEAAQQAIDGLAAR